MRSIEFLTTLSNSEPGVDILIETRDGSMLGIKESPLARSFATNSSGKLLLLSIDLKVSGRVALPAVVSKAGRAFSAGVRLAISCEASGTG